MEGNNMVKLEGKKQKNLKTLSKVIYVLAKIGKVFAIIGTVFAAIGIIIGMVFVNNLDINVKNSNDITIKMGDAVIQYKDENDGVSITSQGEEVKFDDEETIQGMRLVATELTKISKGQIIAYLAVTLVFTVAGLILTAIILDYVNKLFKNISKDDTPFIMENVDYLRKIGWYMVTSTIVSAVGNGIGSEMVGGSFSFGYGFNLIMILIVFAASIIFEYGSNMQEDSDAKIYGSEE